ncbi:MAG: transcription-repair coupling factor [Negativicoccus succinicivorans]|uniref:transcription-repair coupling factor n=1 Tax=Negativicoccus succinicivorans TaxID=620903 RepID=UPI00290A149B|nr:transcription-repair coupling factor [Negativicoccus succinicivorans]MDU5943740.1 transcription-repair coupling factor [Negativicoccus succinicivorans]
MKSGFWQKIKNSARLQELLTAFQTRGAQLIHGGSTAQEAALVAAAMQGGLRHAVIIVEDAATRQKWEDDLRFFAPEIPVYEFPWVEPAPQHVAAQSTETRALRTRALAALQTDEPAAVIATVREASAKIAAPSDLAKQMTTLSLGDARDREAWFARLVAQGYTREEQVESCGEFAVRGDIVDIYAPNYEYPLRLEFFGDEIDSIRSFDPVTQRSVSTYETVTLAPFTLPEGASSLLAYLADGALICDEPSRTAEALRALRKEDAGKSKRHWSWAELLRDSHARSTVFFALISLRVPGAEVHARYPLDGRPAPTFRNQWPHFVQSVQKWSRQGYATIIAAADETKRATLETTLREAGIFPTDEVAAGMVTIVAENVDTGFIWPQEKVVVLATVDIFGTQKKRRRRQVRHGNEIRYFSDLTEGDYVVHQVHGIGRYTGLETITLNGANRDYLRIEYAGEDRLFLPVERIQQLEKYIAPDGTVPTLHKMGGAQWTKAKARAQKSIDDLADKLVALYAEREVEPGFAFPPDTPWQREFEDAFMYEETPDQLQAAAEIKASMEKPQPMDRLLCGDVGFGKTEVAMRAVFKAVMANKQVAVLVPTTVLSQQHYRTFSARLGPFGVNVAVLNRFRSAAEKKEILRGVKNGTIDVLIGTHALLNKAVQFRDLGLLVVDEEQRFGVAQKEKWKARNTMVDVLTLSATPIPRTLHMSLAGVRELSVMYTAPADRQPVQTYVAETSDAILRDAILAEVQRGGQVYFVYNRIATIRDMVRKLETLVGPSVTFDIAHGAMSGEELERVMADFYAGDFDVLVCTSLIENGLDQPNANTIIVYDADRLGLSQLYQMRGRVGRSERNAFAYFLYRPDQIMNEAAEKRLYAIREFTELGAGFKIAMRDLEIRGAGNLLGSEQHGNMVGVGFTTYTTMLDEAIAARQGERAPRKTVAAPLLELTAEAYIPDRYIEDPVQKLEMYRRLAEVDTAVEVSDLIDELVDRFGTPPAPVEQLLRVAQLRVLAAKAGIGSIRELQNTVEITWNRPEAMATWDVSKVPAKVMKSLRFLPGEVPRATINKLQWSHSAVDFLPEILAAFLQEDIAQSKE